MPTLHRYLTLQILRPLGLALLVALVVLLVERMLRLMDLVLGVNGPLQVVFQILAYLVPQYIGLALPISLLLGVMLAFNKLGRDGELDAIHAAGVGIWQLQRPVLLLALLVMVVSLVINGYIRPFGRYAYQAMLHAVTNTAFQTFVRAGVFTHLDDRTFLIEGVRPDGARFARVFVFEREADGRQTAIAAQDGTFARTEADGPPILRLFGGVRMELRPTADTQGEAALAALTVLRFDELRTGLGAPDALMLRQRGVDERELTLTELWQRRHAPPPGVRSSDLIAEFNARLVRALAVPLLPFLGVTLAAGRTRSDRVLGIFGGLIVLMAFNQVVDFAKNLVEDGIAGPLLALWLPWALLSVAIGALFWRASERVAEDPRRWPSLPVFRIAFGRVRGSPEAPR